MYCDKCNVPSGYDDTHMALVAPGLAFCESCYESASPSERSTMETAIGLQAEFEEEFERVFGRPCSPPTADEVSPSIPWWRRITGLLRR